MSADAIALAGRLTVYGLFRSRVRGTPNATAIIAGDRRCTFAELDERVRRLADAFARLGITRGDRIAILSENRPEYIEVMLAAGRIGAILACLNWRLGATELKHCANLVSPKLVLVSARYAGRSEEIAVSGSRLLGIDGDLAALIQAGDADAPEPAVDPEDGLLILYTSGTTGLPKGALISHRAQIARMIAHRLDLRVTEEDAFVAWSPLFHSGAADPTLGALMSGSPTIVIDGFDPVAIVDAIAEHKLGWLILMPGTIEPVVARLRETGVRPKGVRVVGAMADLVPMALLAELTGLLDAPYLNSFGATETGLPPGSAAIIPPGVVPASLSKRRSSLCDLRIVGPDGADVAVGEVGEAAVRGPSVFSGYWNADETNATDFADGWFRMGDLFRRNADDSFDFVDRAKYMIKSGGENIYPAEIERVLLADPRVADAAVIRRRDAAWGEVPVAVVAAVRSGLTAADVDEICLRDLPRYKRPRHVRFIAFEDFPRSTTGKIQRHLLELYDSREET
jgi:fatty-acyl-CoA synthase